MLLEAYYTQIDTILHKLTTLREYIDDTEDYINLQVLKYMYLVYNSYWKLDSHRNKLIQLELILSAANVVGALFPLVTGIFGMNTPFGWNEDHPEAFTWVLVVVSTTCLVVFIAVLGHARYKHLIVS